VDRGARLQSPLEGLGRLVEASAKRGPASVGATRSKSAKTAWAASRAAVVGTGGVGIWVSNAKTSPGSPRSRRSRSNPEAPKRNSGDERGESGRGDGRTRISRAHEDDGRALALIEPIRMSRAWTADSAPAFS
jgi:hypothetical protein